MILSLEALRVFQRRCSPCQFHSLEIIVEPARIGKLFSGFSVYTMSNEKEAEE